jgi:crossover junction endodeoxyribonuclease RusA
MSETIAPRLVAFSVIGMPQPQGSARAFMPRGALFPRVTSDNPRLKEWRDLVAYTAQQHVAKDGQLGGAVVLRVVFQLTRPKSLQRRVVTHTKKPDIDKLCRAVCDALSGVAYHDDSQVTQIYARKVYAPDGRPPGVHIEVEEQLYDEVSARAESLPQGLLFQEW